MASSIPTSPAPQERGEMGTAERGVTPACVPEPGYAAAIHILATLDRAQACIVREGIDLTLMLRAMPEWSVRERILAKIAIDLDDPGCLVECGYMPAGWGEAAAELDDSDLLTVIEAMRIARGRPANRL